MTLCLWLFSLQILSVLVDLIGGTASSALISNILSLMGLMSVYVDDTTSTFEILDNLASATLDLSQQQFVVQLLGEAFHLLVSEVAQSYPDLSSVTELPMFNSTLMSRPVILRANATRLTSELRRAVLRLSRSLVAGESWCLPSGGLVVCSSVTTTSPTGGNSSYVMGNSSVVLPPNWGSYVGLPLGSLVSWSSVEYLLPAFFYASTGTRVRDVYVLNIASGQPVTVQGLSRAQPAILVLNYTNTTGPAGSEPVCRFFSDPLGNFNGSWLSSGMELVSRTPHTMSCATTHFTPFAVYYEPVVIVVPCDACIWCWLVGSWGAFVVAGVGALALDWHRAQHSLDTAASEEPAGQASRPTLLGAIVRHHILLGILFRHLRWTALRRVTVLFSLWIGLLMANSLLGSIPESSVWVAFASAVCVFPVVWILGICFRFTPATRPLPPPAVPLESVNTTTGPVVTGTVVEPPASAPFPPPALPILPLRLKDLDPGRGFGTSLLGYPLKQDPLAKGCGLGIDGDLDPTEPPPLTPLKPILNPFDDFRQILEETFPTVGVPQNPEWFPYKSVEPKSLDLDPPQTSPLVGIPVPIGLLRNPLLPPRSRPPGLPSTGSMHLLPTRSKAQLLSMALQEFRAQRYILGLHLLIQADARGILSPRDEMLFSSLDKVQDVEGAIERAADHLGLLREDITEGLRVDELATSEWAQAKALVQNRHFSHALKSFRVAMLRMNPQAEVSLSCPASLRALAFCFSRLAEAQHRATLLLIAGCVGLAKRPGGITGITEVRPPLYLAER